VNLLEFISHKKGKFINYKHDIDLQPNYI